VRAPPLAELAVDNPSDTPILIKGVEPSLFRIFLRYVCTDDVPKPEDFLKVARELLGVANRFGCKSLKFAAETELAAFGITVDIAVDMIMYVGGCTKVRIALGRSH
jgi:hypothetical protein